MLIEGIIKIEAEINANGNKKPTEKTIESSAGSLESSIKLRNHLASLMKNREKNKFSVSRMKNRASPQILQICQ